MSEDDHEHDGCLCDCDHAEHEATPDSQLPEAKGGMEGDRVPRKRKATKTAVGEGD